MHILDRQEFKVSSCGQRKLWSDCADAQADLSSLGAHVRSYVFSLCDSHRHKKWASARQNQKKKKKKKNGMCAQRRLRSAWASAHWSESLLCAQWIAKDPSFLMRRAKTLIRLGGCPGWSESSHANLLVLSCAGSNDSLSTFSYFLTFVINTIIKIRNWFFKVSRRTLN